MSQASTETADKEHTIPCPTSLTDTSTTLPSKTAQALIAYLRTSTNAIPELSHILTDSLNREGWTDRVRALALELLRNGTCDTFPELMTEVLRRAKIPMQETPQNASSDGKKDKNAGDGSKDKKGESAAAANGTSSQSGPLNGSNAIALSKEWSGGPDGLPSVVLPWNSVDKACVFLEEQVNGHLELDNGDGDDEDSD